MLRDDPRPAQPSEDSERTRLDPFIVATGDAAPRDQRDLMERPFFSLARCRYSPCPNMAWRRSGTPMC